MQGIMTVMEEMFRELQSQGAYFILLVVASVLLYRLYEEKNRGYILYTILLMILVCMNPLMVFVLSKAFPVLASYKFFVLLPPVLIMIPAVVTEVLEKLRDFKKSIILLVLTVFLIAVSGSFFGIYRPSLSDKELLSREEKDIISLLEKENPELILADDAILPFLRTASHKNFQLLYGRDLYQANTDFGIIDIYDEDMMSLYEAMKNPAVTLDDILATAELYGCDTVVVKKPNEGKKVEGHYSRIYESKNYSVYKIE